MTSEQSPVPGVLSPADLARVTESFRVGVEQVTRDHLISHVLAVLSSAIPDEVIFFGGTALARTHLPALRLSEDIDLVAVGSRPEVGRQLQSALERALRRPFGEVSFLPSIPDTRGSEPVVMIAGASSIQIQLLDPVGYPKWPTQRTDLVQRYADAPPARLTVPTRSAFVAGKVSAWIDRGAPRDLYDLWALHELGAFDAESARLFETLGPGGRPAAWMFSVAPDIVEWERALGHQGPIAVDPDTALAAVRSAWLELK